jgi:2-polyprenyl-6-methoxyphenol hydroxylase-like FAD-dependent oxidoreductase
MSSQSAAAAVSDATSAGASDSSLPIVIAGAGLAGCMAALLLAQQYHRHRIAQKIIVLEHREDFRIEDRQVRETVLSGVCLTQ